MKYDTSKKIIQTSVAGNSPIRGIRRFVRFLFLVVCTAVIGIFVTEAYRIIIPELGRRIGMVKDEVKIAGTGSMYPTFPKGEGDSDIARAHEIVAWSKMRSYPTGVTVLGKTWFGYDIGRGDIVSFSNSKTDEVTLKQYNEKLGYVKRVVAVGGDRIEIREGFVVLNGNRLKEPYTARPRSTFGGTALPDCMVLTVPEGYLFVLGDNRTGSSDSRHEIGLVRVIDVDHVLPYADQKDYENMWRDASHDDELVSQPTLDSAQYVKLLNAKRKEAGLNILRYDSRLAASARKRGEVILATDDLSYEASRSGYRMEQAMKEAGYSNITWGEAPALGFYTAEELIENSFSFPDTTIFLLEKDFDDVGVAAVLGNLNGCPTQIVVQHFGGYIPPNYSPEVIENWKQALSNLRDVRPSWLELRERPDFYSRNKSDVDRMIELIDYRISNMEKIISRMENNEWLTADEKLYTQNDSKYYEEQDRIARKLNNS